MLFAVVTGLFFGLVPALHVSDKNLHGSLKDANRGSSQGRSHTWVRNALVVSEIALACVLVVGAGLLIQSFLRVMEVNLGFHPERAVALRDRSGQLLCHARKAQRLLQRSASPRSGNSRRRGAGLTDALPLGHNRTWGAGVKGHVYPRTIIPLAFVRIVSDGYFKSMGIPSARAAISLKLTCRRAKK